MLAAAWTALLLASIPTTSADLPMRTVGVYDGHATIEIPETWNEIPADLLDFLATRTAETSGGRITEYYQHGFRPAPMDSGFELPQVLIQIRESGRLPLAQFVHLPSPEDLAAGTDSLMAEQRGPFLRELDLDAVSFDPARKVLLVDSTMELLVEGTTVVRSASFLTERGVFVVHCYEHASRMTDAAGVFDRIIGSVTFDVDTAYRTRWRDRWTRRHSLVVIGLGLVCLALVVVALRRDRQRQLRDEGSGTPPSEVR